MDAGCAAAGAEGVLGAGGALRAGGALGAGGAYPLGAVGEKPLVGGTSGAGVGGGPCAETPVGGWCAPD